jgi:hypothetical protein
MRDACTERAEILFNQHPCEMRVTVPWHDVGTVTSERVVLGPASWYAVVTA